MQGLLSLCLFALVGLVTVGGQDWGSCADDWRLSGVCSSRRHKFRRARGQCKVTSFGANPNLKINLGSAFGNQCCIPMQDDLKFCAGRSQCNRRNRECCGVTRSECRSVRIRCYNWGWTNINVSQPISCGCLDSSSDLCYPENYYGK